MSHIAPRGGKPFTPVVARNVFSGVRRTHSRRCTTMHYDVLRCSACLHAYLRLQHRRPTDFSSSQKASRIMSELRPCYSLSTCAPETVRTGKQRVDNSLERWSPVKKHDKLCLRWARQQRWYSKRTQLLHASWPQVSIDCSELTGDQHWETTDPCA